MNCPVCGEKTTVLSTRKDCEGVYRYRMCKDTKCNHLFYTSEFESDNENFDRINRELNNERYRRRYKKA